MVPVGKRAVGNVKILLRIGYAALTLVCCVFAQCDTRVECAR